MGVANIEKVRCWFAAGLLFMLTTPMWLWIYNPVISTFFGLAFFIVSFSKIKFRKTSKWLLLAYFIEVIFLWVAIVDENTNVNGFLQLFLTFFIVSTIFCCDKNYWKSVLEKFFVILALLLIPSIIEYILISFFSVKIPYHYICECPANPGREYYIYNFNAYLIMNFDVGRARYFAYYDEPGIVGNIMMVLLYIQKFDLKKWYNIVFGIAGLLSFSLAFYISVIAYFLVVGGIKTKITFIVVAILLVSLFYDNPLVDELLFARMKVEDGQLSGYNREGLDFDSWFSQRSISEYFFFGYSGKVEYAASWKWALVRWGVVPCILYVFCIIMGAIQSHLHFQDIVLVSMIIIVVFIQRPFFANYLYVFLIVVPQIYMSSVRNNYSLNSSARQTLLH